jgi:hypothetical protein
MRNVMQKSRNSLTVDEEIFDVLSGLAFSSLRAVGCMQPIYTFCLF